MLPSDNKHPPVIHVPIIRGGDGYDLGLAMYLNGKNHAIMSALLNEKRHTIKDTDQSYRAINHWSSLGLIEDDRTSDTAWRKLSMLDLIWIQIVGELRQFGFPLEKLKMTQKTLFGGKPNRVPYCLFEFAIAQVFLKSDQRLIVFSDGKAAAVSGEMLDLNHNYFGIENYLFINLNRVISKVFKDKDFSPVIRNAISLDEDEIDVLLRMRSGAYESVSVKMKDGKIELIEAVQSIESQKRFVDLMKEAKYQKIELQTEDGKVVSIKRTVKTKPAAKATENLRASSTEPLRSSEKPKSKAVRSNAHR